jgi:Spy/CpxP family protein refolding chaperone
MAAAGVILGHTARRCLCGTGGPEAGVPGGAPLAQRRQTEWLTRTLDLTPEQRIAVERAEKQYLEGLAAQCASHCAARARLHDVLFAPEADGAATRKLLEAMATAQSACEQATVDHIRRVYSLLTPEQQPRFRQAVLGSVCGGCRTGLHGCQETGNGPPENGTRMGMGCGMKEKRE